MQWKKKHTHNIFVIEKVKLLNLEATLIELFDISMIIHSTQNAASCRELSKYHSGKKRKKNAGQNTRVNEATIINVSENAV